MKRIIVTAPVGITLETLSTEQRLGLDSVMAQFVLPMPGTKEYNEKIVIDCVMKDNFDPQAIVDLGLPFVILGYWEVNPNGVITHINLDSSFINFLPDQVTYDTEGIEIFRQPPVMHLPHMWAGWPVIDIE